MKKTKKPRTLAVGFTDLKLLRLFNRKNTSKIPVFHFITIYNGGNIFCKKPIKIRIIEDK